MPSPIIAAEASLRASTKPHLRRKLVAEEPDQPGGCEDPEVSEVLRPRSAEALEFPPRRLSLLIARLLDELPPDGREQALRHVGEDYGRGLARIAGVRPCTKLQDGLERVCSAVRSLGFQAALARIDGDTVVITTPTCPLRPLVLEHLEAAYMDHGMWAGLVERSLRGIRAERVDCRTHSCLDGSEPCSVIVRISH